jgi:hypothetical protein
MNGLRISQNKESTMISKTHIGYKLKPEFEQFESAAAIIAFANSDAKSFSVGKYGAQLSLNSEPVKRLQKAKLLDLWFEPVYEVLNAFEEGKWYIRDGFMVRALAKTHPTDENRVYYSEMYSNSYQSHVQIYSDWCVASGMRPASEKEVREKLINVAKTKGFGLGISFISALSNHESFAERGNFTMDGENLFLDGNVIYRAGKWAMIIDTTPIDIGGYKIKFNRHSFTVNDVDYHKDELSKFITMLKETPVIKSINVGCSGQIKVDLAILEKIMKRFK